MRICLASRFDDLARPAKATCDFFENKCKAATEAIDPQWLTQFEQRQAHNMSTGRTVVWVQRPNNVALDEPELWR